MTRTPRRTPFPAVLPVVLAAVLLSCAGCGGNGLESTGGSATSTSPSASASPTPSASPSPTPPPTATASSVAKPVPRPSTRASGPAATTPPSPSSGSGGAAAVVHVYAGGESVGLRIAGEADAARLVDPPDGFAAYALGRRQASPPTQLVVGATSTDGWASGGTEDLHDGRPGGGYVAIWHDTGSGWSEPLGTQDEFLCSDLHRLGVPAYPVGPQQCADGEQSLDYTP